MADLLRLKGEEKAVLTLRSLYLSYGYRPYKMSRFEEYDLYAGNKDFLVSGNIITFTDTDGKLMALKPDVTLSIVKSIREGGVSRICYDENVYRVSDRSGTFREIMQAGLECIGDIGQVEVSEVANLAMESLKVISDDCILTISHMGIAEAFLDGLPVELRAPAVSALSSRNVSALQALAKENSAFEDILSKLSKLAMMEGTNEEIYAQLEKIGAEKSCINELQAIVSTLDSSKLRIDFSILDGMKYYNGITFRGYVNGVPVPVVSGGQYDKLMKRMGKRSKAIGFAVYMDPLERLLEESSDYDVDTVLLYREGDGLKDVMDAASRLRSKGESVVTMKQTPSNVRCRKVVTMDQIRGGEANA